MAELIDDVLFEDHMTSMFMSYAKDVITDRAIPDVRDGLKPVQRRIIAAMHGLGLHPNSSYKKCARSVGETLGIYHPHGDSSVYDAMVNMAQPFKTKYPLVDGHGNFGSIDGDRAAAYRYTEAKLSPYGELMMTDIDKNTVNMNLNFDESTTEPEVLPGLFPGLLANGSSGIAVAMVSSFVPHSAKSIYAALDYILGQIINDKEYTEEKVIDIIGAPDFPTGGKIINLNEVREAYKTGIGKVTIRATSHIEKYGRKKDKDAIVVTEIPFKVNKANLIKQIIKLAETDELFAAIEDVRDESDREGMRIVIELRLGAMTDLILHHLYKKTMLQSSISINHTALVNGKPEENLSLLSLLKAFISHAVQVSLNKVKYLKENDEKRIHLVSAIISILDDLDKTLEIMRGKSRNACIEKLKEEFNFDDAQAKYVSEMRLYSLNEEDIAKYNEEFTSLKDEIEYFNEVISVPKTLLTYVKNELVNTAQIFKKEKRCSEITSIVDTGKTEAAEFNGMIQDIVMAYTHRGYIKAILTEDYNAQRRNGKGSSFIVREDDFVKSIESLKSDDELLFVTDKGKGITFPAFKIPISSKTSLGKSINAYAKLDMNEKVFSFIPFKKKSIDDDNLSLIFVTKQGFVKKLPVASIPKTSNGAKLLSLRNEDELIFCGIGHENDKLMMITKTGLATQVKISEFSAQGRTGSGVTGIRFKHKDDTTVAAAIVTENKKIVLVTDNGIGKKIDPSIVNVVHRGGKGVICYKPDNELGFINSFVQVSDDETVIITTQKNKLIRIPVSNFNEYSSRTAKGVRVVNLENNDKVIAVSSAASEIQEDSDE